VHKSFLIAEEYGGVSPAVHDALPYVACVRVFISESFLKSKMKLRPPVGFTSSTIASFFFFLFLQRLAHFAQSNCSIRDAAQPSNRQKGTISHHPVHQIAISYARSFPILILAFPG
jgi:hypothetical protein